MNIFPTLDKMNYENEGKIKEKKRCSLNKIYEYKLDKYSKNKLNWNLLKDHKDIKNRFYTFQISCLNITKHTKGEILSYFRFLQN